MKNHINVSYTASTEPLHKYRALAIARPTVNMTGTYSCNVESYDSKDRRSAELQVIKPETDLRVQIEENDDSETVKVQCTVEDIYPEPKLSVL